jgi:hypothetical protein
MLGLGGKNVETIIEVFQLNDEQLQKMEAWRSELAVENKAYQEEIDMLFDTHPQSTMEELEALATKYRKLKDRILENAREYDVRMLKIFNPRQYERYLELCASAQRTPIQVVPTTYPKSDHE